MGTAQNEVLARSQKAWWTLRPWFTSKKDATLQVPLSSVPSISWFLPSAFLMALPLASQSLNLMATYLYSPQAHIFAIAWGRVSLCGPSWLKTQPFCLSVEAQVLQMWATMPGLCANFHCTGSPDQSFLLSYTHISCSPACCIHAQKQLPTSLPQQSQGSASYGTSNIMASLNKPPCPLLGLTFKLIPPSLAKLFSFQLHPVPTPHGFVPYGQMYFHSNISLPRLKQNFKLL